MGKGEQQMTKQNNAVWAVLSADRCFHWNLLLPGTAFTLAPRSRAC